MRTTSTFLRWLAAAAVAAVSSSGWAQQPDPATAAAPPAASDAALGVPSPGDGEAPFPGIYSYEVKGRRDPFRSLLIRKQNDNDRQKPPGIAGMLVEELELQGTIRVKGIWIAQMRGGDNRSYLLRKGDTVFDGEVAEVAPTEIVFRQNVTDPTSPKPFKDVVKSLALQRP